MSQEGFRVVPIYVYACNPNVISKKRIIISHIQYNISSYVRTSFLSNLFVSHYCQYLEFNPHHDRGVIYMFIDCIHGKGKDRNIYLARHSVLDQMLSGSKPINFPIHYYQLYLCYSILTKLSPHPIV